MIVLDASASIEFILGRSTGERVAERMEQPDTSICAPHLLDVEVANALRGWVRLGRIAENRAREAMDDLRDLPLTRYPHMPLLPRIWSLRSSASAYDAAYIALAEMLDAPLVTCDRRIEGIPGHSAVVEVV